MKEKDNYNIINDILDKTQEEIAKMGKINILVCGKTGSGKSTLINSLFREKMADTGVGRPVTEHLRKISREDVPLVLYDTRGLELDEAIQAQVFNEINDLDNSTKGTEEELNICYYCINAGSNRIEPIEIDLIKSISRKIPVILVLTMSIGQPAKNLKSYIDNLNLPVVSTVNVMAKDYQVSDDYVLPAFGLKDLVGLTLESIPEEKRKAFNNAQQADIKRKADEAYSWAKKYVAASFGVGFVPIPFADASILVPMQVTIIAHITAIFGISLSKSSLVSIVAAIGGTGGATYLGRTIVANILKFVPGSSAATGLISGSTAALVTSALAMSYIKVLTLVSQMEFESDKNKANLISELLKKEYKLALKKKSDDLVDDDIVPDKEGIFDRVRGIFKKK